jgi:hypothetical protein
MTTPVSFVVDEARRILRDTRTTAQRYTDSDYIAAVNIGQRMMVNIGTNVNVVTQLLTLVPGVLQSVPDDCLEFHHVIRNMGPDGTTLGASVVPVSQAEMDAADSSWYTATPATEVIHSILSGNDDRYFVYPPQTAIPQQVEVEYVRLPADISALTDNINVRDKYGSALPYFCASYLLSQNSENEGSASRAASYMAAFVSQIGLLPGAE